MSGRESHFPSALPVTTRCLRLWLYALSLLTSVATARAEIICLSVDGGVHVGAGVFIETTDPCPNDCVLASDPRPFRRIFGCSAGGTSDEAATSCEFGSASSRASYTFSANEFGASFSGETSGQGEIGVMIPLLVAAGVGTVRGDISYRITEPVIATIQISTSDPFPSPPNYNFSTTGAKENRFGSGPGSWRVLICPATSAGAEFRLHAEVSGGGGGSQFYQTERGFGTANVSASVSFVPVNDCLTASLRALEVTQSIQDWSNSVPLIEGKKTFVRAHLEAVIPEGAGRHVSGRLRGFRPSGAQLPGPPLRPLTDFPFQDPAELVTDVVEQRETFLHEASKSALTFALPEPWCTGQLKLRFDTDDAELEQNPPPARAGANTNGEVQVTFTATARPKLIVCPVKIAGGGGRPSAGPSAAEIQEVVEKAVNMYPVTRFDWTVGSPIIVRTANPFPSDEEISDAVADRRFHTPGLTGFMVGVVADADLPRSPRVNGQATAAFDSAWAANDPPEAFAHELGHLLGRQHAIHRRFGSENIAGIVVLKGNCGEKADGVTSDFPHFFTIRDDVASQTTLRPTLGPMDLGPAAKIFGFRWRQATFTPLSPSNTFELMSYCGPGRWVSDYTFGELQFAIQQKFGTTPPGPAPSPSPLRMTASSPDRLLIRGAVHVNDNTVDWLPFQCLAQAPGILEQPGSYLLHVLDGDGNVLHGTTFGAGLVDDFEESAAPFRAPFLVGVPADTRARRIEIRAGETLIAARDASANAPAVRVVAPNGGETINTPEVEFRWQGSDADGDPVSYTVQYSADDGARWTTLAADLPFTNLVLRTDELAGGIQARLRVLASDGFNCVSDDSDGSFAISDKGPETFIVSPGDGTRFYGNQTVAFEAFASDIEEGAVSSGSFEWRSDRNGLLGTGETLARSAADLAEGEHVIRLTARDSKGNATSVTNRIIVGRVRPARLKILTAPTNGLATLQLLGEVPSRSIIETSTNLVHWTPSQVVTQRTLAQMVTDSFAPGQPARFYRIRSESVPRPPPSAPTIAAPPANSVVIAGQTLFLTIGAIGDPPLFYQWHFNGSPLEGQTNALLIVTNAGLAQAGEYFATVSNVADVATSVNVTVTVLESAYAVLHAFGTVTNDGINGWGKLTVGSDGAIYGCARNGAISNAGCVFRVLPNGTSYSVLHRFQVATDGGTPLGGVIEGSDGSLYGTTSVGGANNSGTVFKLNKDGSGFTVLRHFLSLSDCRNPQAELIEASDGMLYGTGYNGGGFTRGGAFKLNKDGSGYALISGLNFGGLEAPRQPLGGLIEGLDGFLYGTSEFGGSSSNGAIFKLSKDGTNATVIKSLGIVAGGAVQPNGTLLQAGDGLLYGTSAFGGAATAYGNVTNHGTIFRIATNGSDFAVVHNFGAGEGQEPRTGLIQTANGTLLGTTRVGGGPDKGTVFRVHTNGFLTTLRSLNDFFGDGVRPRGPLVSGGNGFYYGTTFGGGNNDRGVVFRLYVP